ncbi:MAG: hypothetical protein ABWX96_06360, partial [Propionibacteriaceae bacterium]
MISFYAGRRNAFAELAAAIVSSDEGAYGEVALDEDLCPDLSADLTGVDELRDINRAIGVLLSRARTTTDGAFAELRDEA